jgi:hypothetical protein
VQSQLRACSGKPAKIGVSRSPAKRVGREAMRVQLPRFPLYAPVVEQADTPVREAGVLRREGSTPSGRTEGVGWVTQQKPRELVDKARHSHNFRTCSSVR